MVFLTSFLFGSFSTIISWQFLKLGLRIFPYYTSSSKFVRNLQNSQIKRIAIIIGGTDGIGKQYSAFLSKCKYQLFIIGRNKQKIINLLKQNEKNYLKFQQQNKNQQQLQSKKVQNFEQIDFSTNGSNQYNIFLENISQKLIKENLSLNNTSKLIKYQIGIINCVGQAHVSRYEEMNFSQIEKINSVNLNSIHFGLKLLSLISLQLQKRHVSKQLFFINLSSVVGQFPNTYSSIYSACKAYQSNLMKVMNLQEKDSLKQEKIVYLNIQPWYVSTKMVRFLKSWDTVSPKDIVQGSFKILQKKQSGAGCIKHQIFSCFSSIVKYLLKQRPKKALELVDKMKQMKNKRNKKI